MKLRYLLLGLIPALCACDNPEGAANQLYVNASQAASLASTEQDPLRRYELLKDSADDVQRITTQYPSTAAALRVAANENIGPYTRDALRNALADASATPAVCAATLRRDCFLAAINASLRHLNGPLTGTEDDKRHFDIAIAGWPYAKLWEPEQLDAIFKGDPKAVSDLGAQSARDALPAFLLNVHETKGIDAAAAALADMASNQAVGEQIKSNFGYHYTNRLARRNSVPYSDLIRLASVVESPLSDDVQRQIGTNVCTLSRNPTVDAAKIAQCPADAVIAASLLFSSLTPDQAETLYAGANSENRKKLARNYFDATSTKPDLQVQWLERASYATDATKLCAVYRLRLRQRLDVKPLAKLLDASPEAKAATPLAQAGITDRNLCLLHASGEFAAQLPAVLQNLQAIPTFSQDVYDRFTTTVDLAGSSSLDLTPVIDAARAVTARWVGQDASKLYFNYAVSSAILRRKDDPVPLLRRYFDGDAYLRNIGYTALLRIRDHGHTDIYDKAIALPAEKTGLPAQALTMRMESMRDSGDTEGFLATLAKLDDEHRVGSLRGLFSTRGKINPRGAVYDAVLERYPVQFLQAQHFSSIDDVGLTPEEQVRILIAHPDLLGRTGAVGYDWVIQGMRGLTEPEQRKAIQIIAASDPVEWINPAGWYLMAHTP
jgi:hypothetical protein